MDEGWIEKIIKKNMQSEKSLEDIYKDIERETEEECFDREDL